MRLQIFKLLLACSLLTASIPAVSQNFSYDSLSVRYSRFSTWCSPEKLFLHIDRTYYSSGEAVWFMGYLSNASQMASLPLSRYIYVELLDNSGDVLARCKVKRTSGGFPGHLDIPESAKSGNYTLRAYTLWQMNASSEYMFNQSIRILGSGKENTQRKPSTDIDVSFYPEGGRYFEGYMSAIAFKVMDAEGRSVDISGHIVENGADSIVNVSTRHDGMGVINFYPKKGSSYSLVTESGQTFPLPAPAREGASVSLRRLGAFIYLSVNGVSAEPLTLLVRDATELNKVADLTVDGKPHFFKFNPSSFRPGINHFLLVDRRGNIISERLLFSYGSPETFPVCSVTPNTMRPHQRALISAGVKLTDENGNPFDGKFSVSVVRGSFKNHIQDDGFVSYLRLSSELRGHINDPYYYFDDSVALSERQANIDLLMMVQGWTYYDVPKLISGEKGPLTIRHMKEYWQEIKVRVDRFASHKTPKKFIFTVLIPKLKVRHFVTVEEGRNFLIDSLDFPENTEFLINASRSGLGPGYLPKWSGEKFAAGFKYVPAPGYAAEKTAGREIPMVTAVGLLDTLNAAVVSAASEDDFVGGVFGRSVSAEDLKNYANFTLVEYLKLRVPAFEFNGEQMYNKRIGGPRYQDYGTSENENENDFSFGMDDEVSGGVKLIVNDMEEAWWGYDMLYMSDIASVAYSSQPDPVYNSPGGIVMLKLKSDKVKNSFASRDPSLLYCVPLGYQLPKEFYAPRYDRGDKGDGFDCRNTIYWNPEVDVIGGHAAIQFCNTDQMDYPYYVQIEGLTSIGVPFSHRCTLDFKE